MGKSTSIEWTDSTWNPIRGCSRVSEGCRNCYAEAVAARFSKLGQAYFGLANFQIIGEGTPDERIEPHWTGDVRLIEKHLEDPIRWKEPRKIFVNSMSDLFHPRIQADWLAAIFDVMARAPQHVYQILTKRPERMLEALRAASAPQVVRSFQSTYGTWPCPNWWFGVSVEDQETANHRLPILAKCPAAVRFISYEPALGPVDLALAMGANVLISLFDWVICGGESGPHARPMHPAWARLVRDQCAASDIPFFFKQWGEWRPGESAEFGKYREDVSTGQLMVRVGKHAAAAALDGLEYKEFPQC